MQSIVKKDLAPFGTSTIVSWAPFFLKFIKNSKLCTELTPNSRVVLFFFFLHETKKKPTSTLKLMNPQKDAVFVNLPDTSVAGKSMFRPVWSTPEEGSEGGWLKRALVDMAAEGCLSISR